MFWPDKDEEKSRNNLHVTLHALKHVLEPDPSKRKNSSCVLVHNGKYYLETSTIWLDADRFELLVEACNAGELDVERIAVCEKGLALYRGDFLRENAYDDWPVPLPLLELGNFHGAIKQYDECQRFLEGELGVKPREIRLSC